VQGVPRLAGDEVVDQVRGDREADAVAAQTSQLADGVGEVRLADAAGADEDDVALVPNEVEGGSLGDDVSVDLLRVVEVVRIEVVTGKMPLRFSAA